MNLSVNADEFQWEQKYRPQTLAECILPAKDKKVFTEIVKRGEIPSMILHSPRPGTGKTTIALALVREVNCDYMFVNGADCNLAMIRDQFKPFAVSGSIDPERAGKRKVIIIDEFDRPELIASHKHLRSFSEAYSDKVTFIVTANDINGIHNALHSRFTPIEFGIASREDTVAMMKQGIQRCKAILDNEGIPCEDMRVLASLVKQNFPDMRRTIKELDYYSKFGKIDAGILSMVDHNDYDLSELIEGLRTKSFANIRKLTPQYASTYHIFIKKLYNELYDKVTPASIGRMIEEIGDNNRTFAVAADKEIHITFLLFRLMVELEFK